MFLRVLQYRGDIKNIAYFVCLEYNKLTGRLLSFRLDIGVGGMEGVVDIDFFGVAVDWQLLRGWQVC